MQMTRNTDAKGDKRDERGRQWEEEGKHREQVCSNKDASERRDQARIAERDLSDLSDVNITVRVSEGSLSQLFQ